MRSLVPALLVVLASAAVAGPAGAQQPAGTVTAVAPLDRDLWIPGTTAKAFRLTYVTSDARGRSALSTGELFLPKGTAPQGGWPVVSWAHGTSGLGDTCAPSVMGPALPERDFAYLARWMREGYAVVASDYVGLGTDGLHPYLHGRASAHSVVDAVKAGRAYAHRRLGPGEQLSNRWVTIGQSQGGGASIYTARHATEYGGPGLAYLGAVGTGTPAYVESLVGALGPGVPTISVGLTAYLTYLVASVRDVHPELGIDGILTDTGRRYLELAETRCLFDFEKDLEGVQIGEFFTAPLATLPGWDATIRDYMAMPESGFDRPFFMGHGLVDVDVPFAITAPYVARLQLNGEPLTFRSYPTDHSGALQQSQADSVPFLRKLVAEAGPGPEVAPATTPRVTLARRARLATALRRGLRVRVDAPALTPVTVVARSGGRRVATAAGMTSVDATATLTARFTSAFRRRAARADAVTLRLRAAGATRTVRIRR